MNRGRHGENIFETKEDYSTFVELLKELNDVFNVKVAAYCLMSNHYHLLVQTPDANLSRSMRHLNGVYTQRYNRRHSCDGQLFRGRYKSIVVESDSYALELVRYIHRNPLEAGLVDSLTKYQWSSHKLYLSDAKKWKWLHKDYILKLFSKSKTESIRLYRQFILKGIPEEINQIFGGRRLPTVLGSKSFVDRIRDTFFASKNFEEIPEAKKLGPDIDRIKRTVCKAYNIEETDLYVSRRGYFNEPRNAAIYLARHVRNDTLRSIGRQFHIEKYSTVSSIVEKVKYEMRVDKGLKKRVQNLAAKITNSQRQT